MLRVPLTSAKPGMVLALPVYHPRRQDTALLAQGVTLDPRSIRRLREIHLADVWVEYPPLSFLSDFVSEQIVATRADLAYVVGGVFNEVMDDAHAKLDFLSFRRAIASLLDAVRASPKAAIYIQEMVDRDHPALRHAVNVCFLSLLMGLKLDDYLVIQRSRLRTVAARDVTSLGVGALLHDVGMLRLDPEVIRRWEQKGDESDPQWREHVHIGYDMVKGKISAPAAAAVLHHHQSWDGAGFPPRRMLDGSLRRLAGEDIHVFARIVAAADVFDRLRNPYGAARPTPAVRALRIVHQHFVDSRLDPMTFKALLAVVPAYAPGSIVTLSSGDRGVVTEWFPDDPCRPTLHVGEDLEAGFDDADPKLTRVALREHAELSIVETEGVDVSRDNFHAEKPGEFDLRLAGRALFNRADDLTEEQADRRVG